MAWGEENISVQVKNIYDNLFSNLPVWAQNFTNIIFLVVIITLFCIFIWKIYTIISKKNLLELNLKQYNKASHPIFEKSLGVLLYFIEYIIIFPFFVFFWFLIFNIFLILLTKGIEVQAILMISAIIIIAIRATAYYKEELSKDLAKLLPFTLLAVAITQKGFFNFEEILGRFSQIPLFLNNILGYLAIIVLIEIILRVFDFIFSLFHLNDEPVEAVEPSEEEEEGKN